MGISKKGRLGAIAKDNKYCLISFAVTAGIMIFAYFCYSLFPFGGYSILRMDLYHQYGPLFAELYDRVTSGESLIYSWNTGLGSCFLGNYFNYLSSPLGIVMFLCGHMGMTEAIAIMVLLKASFASMFFSYYLKQSFKGNDLVIVAFGVLYAFCGWFIAYYWNVMWVDAMALLPLVLLGINKIIKNGSGKLYTITLAIAMFSNYYMAYILCLFSAIYFIYYYFSNYAINSKLTRIEAIRADDGSPIEDYKHHPGLLKSIKNSRFLCSGVRFAFCSVCAACIVAVALIPTYYILQSCSATSGTFPEEIKTYFSVFDFIANHFSAVEPTIRSSGTDVLPNISSGILTLMLVPLFFYSSAAKKREKLATALLLALLFFSFNFNSLNYIWHGFHFPNDLPYRFSFVYSFIIIVMAYRVIDKLHEFSSKQLLTAGIGTLMFLVLAQKITSKNVDNDTVLICITFIFLYTFVLSYFRDKKQSRSAVALLVLCCVIAEVAMADVDHFLMNQVKENFVCDYDDFKTVQADFDSKEEDKFYRMELTDSRARMDPSWFDYNGISVFSSMAYEKTANLMDRLGTDGNFINSYTYMMLQTPIFNMMMNLKYIVNNTDNVVFNPNIYTELKTVDRFTSYKNNYCLPLAYLVNSDILTWDYDDENAFYVQNEYFKCATGIENVLEPIEIAGFDYDNIDTFTEGTETGDLVFYRSVAGQQANFTVSYDIEKAQDLYLFIRSSNITEISIYNGTTSFNHNYDGEHIIGIGQVEEGDKVTINIPIDNGDSGYVDCYLYGLNEEKFIDGYNQLVDGGLNIDTFDETYIKGSLNADKDGVVYTSIPFDLGWSVTVDGVAVSKEDMENDKIANGLIGFRVTEGEHTIEFKYEAKGLKLGAIISLTTIVFLAIFILICKKNKKVFALLGGYADDTVTKTIVVEALPEPIQSIDMLDDPDIGDGPVQFDIVFDNQVFLDDDIQLTTEKEDESDVEEAAEKSSDDDDVSE